MFSVTAYRLNGVDLLNQLFIFKRLGMLTRLFSDLKLDIDYSNIDKTVIDYAWENYGKNIVFNLPFDMVESGEFIKEVYPHDVPVGLVDDMEKFGRNIYDRLDSFDYIMLYSESLLDIISFRSFLKQLMHVRPGFKRIIVLRIDKGTEKDDIDLFIEMSRIYGYRPVLLIRDERVYDDVRLLFNLADARHCTTKWFNYDVKIFFIRGTLDTLTVLAPSDNSDIEMVSFRDCIAFLCHGHGQLSLSSIISFIYENSKPVLRIGDVLIDDSFINIIDYIMEYKSIRATSKLVGISYSRIRRTIKDLERIEKILGIQLIETRRGGSEHGKTVFTHIGRIVFDNIRELYSELVKAYSSVVTNTMEELRGRDNKPLCIFPLSI